MYRPELIIDRSVFEKWDSHIASLQSCFQICILSGVVNLQLQILIIGFQSVMKCCVVNFKLYQNVFITSKIG